MLILLGIDKTLLDEENHFYTNHYIFETKTTTLDIEQLYKENFEGLHRYVFTILKDSDAASDVVQDVFLKFFRLIQQNTSVYNQRAYLYRMARNMAIDYLKSNQRIHYEIPGAVSATPDDTGNQQDAIEQKEIADEQRKIIERVLAELSPQVRIVFEKSRVEGKKYREIGNELSISEKTVEAHISKALKIIRHFVRVNNKPFSLLILLLLYAAA